MGTGGNNVPNVIGGLQKNAAIMKDQSPALTTAMGQGGGHTPMVVPVLTPERQNGRRFKEDGEPSFTLTGQDKHGVMIADKEPKEKLSAMRWQRTEKGKQARRESQKKGRDYTPFSDGHRELVPVEGKPVGTLTAQAIAKDSLIGNDVMIRRLTPTECMRLQGFEDSWCDIGADGKEISDSRKYMMAGNAVTVNVVKAIMERLL